MNLPTLIVSALLVVMVIQIIRYIRKNGVDTCSGSCEDCNHGSCNKMKDDLLRARRDIQNEHSSI